MSNLLEALKSVSSIVCDTADIKQLKEFKADDATTNPTLLLAAAQLPEYSALLDDAIAYGRKINTEDREEMITAICDRLAVNFGKELLNLVPGFVSTEIDASLSFSSEAHKKARKLLKMYEEVGVPRDRILIKIPATWSGICVAEFLEKDGIKCNLTLVFSLTQAIAAGEKNVFLISPFVGRVLDWHKANDPEADFSGMNDPGVKTVTEIHNYYQSNDHKTIVMAASFRNIDEIRNVAGCEKITVSPKLLKELMETPATGFQRKLHKFSPPAGFKWQMCQDVMASEKLAEGIRNFHADTQKLRTFIASKLS